MIDVYGLTLTVPQVVQGLSEQAAKFYREKVPLKEGVRQYLNEFRARNIPMSIATAGDRKNTEAALKRLKVYSYFQGIFTCSEVGSGKSHPDIYLAAALQMDTEPENTWVFEDAYHAVLTAKKAGFRTAAVYDKANDKQLARIWNTADIYLPEFSDFELFYKRAS